MLEKQGEEVVFADTNQVLEILADEFAPATIVALTDTSKVLDILADEGNNLEMVFADTSKVLELLDDQDA